MKSRSKDVINTNAMNTIGAKPSVLQDLLQIIVTWSIATCSLHHTSFLCQKQKFHGVVYCVSRFFIVWLSLKTLCSRVSLFAGLAAFLTPLQAFDGQETAMASFQLYGVSHRSNNTTGSSLIIAHWQINFLAICAWHCSMAQCRDTAGRVQCAFLWLLLLAKLAIMDM